MGAVYLVRHGQASFGSKDYDQLSELGEWQARRVGAALASSGLRPSVVVSGSLERQARTAAAIADETSRSASVIIDPDWNEFDHIGLARADGDSALWADSRGFQQRLETGMREWFGGRAEFAETFEHFARRTETAFERLVSGHAGRGPVVVVSSGGVISWLATSLLAGGLEQWVRLNRVCVNAAITTIVVGRSGCSLVSFNGHDHIPQSDVTYR